MQNRLSKLINTQAQNVTSTSRVNFSFLSEEISYPLVVSAKSPGLILSEWVSENREEFNQKLKLHGAILMRGFKIDTVEKFQNFIKVFDVAPLEYKQRSSPRFEVARNIYHSTTYPQDQHINMHSENSYAFNWGRNIVFCCIQPAEELGETPIADNRLVVKYLSESTRKNFLNKGVKYIRNISPGIGLPWEEVFQTKERKVVEEECVKSGMDYRWEEENRLVLSWNNKAIYNHPDTNEQIWFNHAFFFNKYALGDDAFNSFENEDDLPFNTYYGDGSEITKAEIEEIRLAYAKATVMFPWIKGDVLFLDNMMSAHGRSPYKGDREIIVSMF
ncbi:TauD/TfdA family dioxygenase [Pedobacter sp. UYP1]|uniref:TauD/TfdA family dioxygenase n=1 Tax=Pedobacter sp. UYP1 TaxID=1756396 RepID=UPI00339AC934